MAKLSKTLLFTMCILAIVLGTSCADNDAETLKSFAAQLKLPEETETSLELKPTYTYNNQTINVQWVSADPSVISETGEIATVENDTQVVLVANMSLKNLNMKKTFFVTVLKDITLETLDKAANMLMLPQEVKSSLKLPSSKKVNGKEVKIEWISSHPEFFDETGRVVLPKVDTKVQVTARLTLNNQMKEKKFEINIPRDDKYSPILYWHTAEVYLGKIEGEKPHGELSQFDGAIYHKVASSFDKWLGIEGTVTLPDFFPDEARIEPDPNRPGHTRWLDNISVYMGGNSFKESDVGVAWEHCADPASNPEITGKEWEVYPDKPIAFRPFWRWIDAGQNNYAAADWRKPYYNYYPGDKIRMSVISSRPNYLQLRIELLEETTIDKYVKLRESYKLGEDYPKVFISPEFRSEGMGDYEAEFKRVNAIDQYHNEGKPTQKTNAVHYNAIWHEVYLYRNINGEIFKVPLTQDRMAVYNAPSSFKGAHHISYDGVNTALGGEVVTLKPNNNK